MKEGRGPIYMDTVTALAKLRETLTPREVKHLEAEAWEDFLDMCIGQCGIWVGENIEPEKKNSELIPTEPYLLGSHSGCCGIWGPSGHRTFAAHTMQAAAGRHRKSQSGAGVNILLYCATILQTIQAYK